MTRAARARAVACAASATWLLAACVAIPTGGPVTAGGSGEVGEQSGVVLFAQGPQSGADPTRIVEGFLLASDAEVTGDFEVTREFLAADERSEWDPGAETIVASTTKVEQTGGAQVTVSLTVKAKVDAGGRYREVPTDALETLRYELVQDARGAWRIAHAPDVLVVTARRFAQQFRATSVYFLTPDRRMLVPEERWFRNRGVPTAVVRALLAGPSPFLQDAVTSALPPGTELKPAAVSVERGVAEMTFEPARLVQEADRGLLLAQLDASLRPLGVTSLVVRAGAGGPVIDGVPDGLPAPRAGELEMLVDGQPYRLVDGTPVPVDGVGPIQGARPGSAARSADGAVRVALADASTLVTVPVGGGEQRTLLTGTSLAAPSVDRYAWVWTARGVGAGRLDAVRLDGVTVEVSADWLAGRTVHALRVSRDGTRVAVVSGGTDGVTLDVAGIVRDDGGAPLTLGRAVRAGASLTPTTDAPIVWYDDVTLGVLAEGDAGATPYLVPVAGGSTPLPAVADPVELAADRDGHSLFVVKADGDVLRYEGGTWVAVPGVTGAIDVTGVAFPG